MPDSAAVRAALYARVSTTKQETEPQLEELRSYIERRGWRIAREYVDVAPGPDAGRPNLQRLFQDAHRHEFDLVLVWKFDRFARSLRHLVMSLEEFRALKIDFCSLTEAVDTSTPQGKLLFHLLGAMAEFERDLIRERILLGMGSARARGKHLGRFPTPLDEAKVRSDYEGLKSYRKVARLHRCSPTTIRDLVTGRRQLKWAGQRKPDK